MLTCSTACSSFNCTHYSIFFLTRYSSSYNIQSTHWLSSKSHQRVLTEHSSLSRSFTSERRTIPFQRNSSSYWKKQQNRHRQRIPTPHKQSTNRFDHHTRTHNKLFKLPIKSIYSSSAPPRQLILSDKKQTTLNRVERIRGGVSLRQLTRTVVSLPSPAARAQFLSTPAASLRLFFIAVASSQVNTVNDCSNRDNSPFKHTPTATRLGTDADTMATSSYLAQTK